MCVHSVVVLISKYRVAFMLRNLCSRLSAPGSADAQTSVVSAGRVIVCVVALWFCVLALTGCEKCFTPDAASLNELVAQSAPRDAVTADATELDLYVDDSGSMRGYVTDPQSNYRTVLRELLQNAASRNYRLRVLKFSGGVNDASGLHFEPLLRPGFYNGDDTPLTALFRSLPASRNRVVVLISDLVLSDNRTNYAELAHTLAALPFPEVKLLAFRSSFSGRYVPEAANPANHHRDPIDPLTLGQTLPGKGRPFYLLIAAPNRRSMMSVSEGILNRLPSAVQEFEPRRGVVLERPTANFASPAGRIWAMDPGPPASETEVGRRINSTFSLTRSGNSAPLVLPLSFPARFHVSLRDLRRLGLTTRRVVRTNNQWRDLQPDAVKVQDGKVEDGKLKLSLALAEPAAKQCEVYHIRMSPGQNNADPPPWVNEWSTAEDWKQENGNRTYNLKLLVQAMTNAMAESSVFCHYVLVIKGKGCQ